MHLSLSLPVGVFLDGSPTVSRATLASGYVGHYVVELGIPSIVNRGVGELRIVMNGEESSFTSNPIRRCSNVYPVCT